MSNDKMYQQLIHKAKWQRLRHLKLQQHPLCEMCERQGITTLATEVHHITPVEYAINDEGKRQLMYSLSNLMSVCHACHVKIHTEMGRSGKKRNAAVMDEQRKQLREKYQL